MRNNFFIQLLIYAFVIAGLISVYMIYTIEIRRLSREKIILEDSLSLVSNKINEKLVVVQQLSSEDRIVKFAIDSLKLEYNNDGVFEIVVDKNKADIIEKKVNSIYE
ncbi:MAG: hypothetical protein V1773_13380 [bacterium]